MDITAAKANAYELRLKVVGSDILCADEGWCGCSEDERLILSMTSSEDFTPSEVIKAAANHIFKVKNSARYRDESRMAWCDKCGQVWNQMQYHCWTPGCDGKATIHKK